MNETPRQTQTYRKPWLLTLVVVTLGATFLVAGWNLVALGGSPYYLLSGSVLLVCALGLFRRDPRAAPLYGIFFVATVVWAFYEVGPDPWALMPRLGMPATIGLWFLLPGVRRSLLQSTPPALLQKNTTRLGIASIALLLAYISYTQQGINANPASAPGTGQIHNPLGNWAHYGATQAGTRFAPHREITPENVAQLETAWIHRTGVVGNFKATPLQIGDSLFFCTGGNIITALDVDTGEERWRYDPQITGRDAIFWSTCRGVTYYEAPPGTTDTCQARLLTATTDARMIAVDAASGEPCSDFGEDGQISLLPGMGEFTPGLYYATSPPTIASGVAVLGGLVKDNQEILEPSGVVRGFDPISGRLLWAWDLGREETRTLPPEGEAYTRGTPNAWSLFSADDDLGLVYIPTGNATPDYFGGHRSEAMDKYASSIIALDARSGRVRWHFQTTHHDIWDYDASSQPVLVDVPVGGVSRKAVIVPTKRGELFLFDRLTGEPLTEIEERPTPQTDVAQDWTSPTQPFSVGMPSFAGAPVREQDMWGISPLDQLWCRIRFRQLRYEGPLTPPSINGSLQYPGIGGGMNWGSVAVDEVNQLMVVNSLHLPFVVSLIPRDQVGQDHFFGMGGHQKGTPYAAYSMPFFSPLYVPCMQPPFGELAVVDLASQTILWQRPLGSLRLSDSSSGLPVGLPYFGGAVVTRGGLIFMGGTIDRTLRAIDLYSGQELWSDVLPENAEATPMSYVSPNTGRQYVVITVPEGGGIIPGSAAKSGDDPADKSALGGHVIAYRLPR
jgi:membrane-bound PQQ-dependent dehydrogenase (glucose/quinate/shikimate family)